jgi:hypothetical protein
MKKTTIVLTAVGGFFALLTLGGTALVIKNQADAAAAKKAYEDRPIVEQSCTMNGYGQGACSFTNSGKTAGALCGYIQVDGPGTATSNKFCSGQVASQTTTKVEFNIPQVDELCDNGFDSWTEKCSFEFISETAPAQSAPEA